MTNHPLEQLLEGLFASVFGVPNLSVVNRHQAWYLPRGFKHPKLSEVLLSCLNTAHRPLLGFGVIGGVITNWKFVAPARSNSGV